MKNLLRLLMIVCCFFPVIGLNNAYAWSGSGHRLITSLAWNEMTPETQRMVYDLLVSGRDDKNGSKCDDRIFSDMSQKMYIFANSSSWLDCARGEVPIEPFNTIYHADRYPLCAKVNGQELTTGYLPRTAYRHRASDSLEQAIKTFQNPASDQKTRRTALKVIIHLMTDLHQPLHVVTTSDPLKQMSMVKISSTAQPIYFHAYWDGDVIQAVRDNKSALIKYLNDNKSKMAQGTLYDWLNETQKEGREMSYGKLYGRSNLCAIESVIVPKGQEVTQPDPKHIKVLPVNYQIESRDLAMKQVAKGAVRLARILNESTTKLGYKIPTNPTTTNPKQSQRRLSSANPTVEDFLELDVSRFDNDEQQGRNHYHKEDEEK